MKLGAYSVCDVKIATYNRPFFCKNDADAIRSFDWTINIDSVENSPVYNFAEDYLLFCIGEFDMDTGVLTPCEPRSICSGLSVRRPRVPAFDSGAPASQTPTPQASNVVEADK